MYRELFPVPRTSAFTMSRGSMGELTRRGGKDVFVQFERAGIVLVWWIEPERDRVCVLRGRVKGVAEVHKECVAAPPKPVLDKGV